jgi:hypothetical protein
MRKYLKVEKSYADFLSKIYVASKSLNVDLIYVTPIKFKYENFDLITLEHRKD